MPFSKIHLLKSSGALAALAAAFYAGLMTGKNELGLEDPIVVSPKLKLLGDLQNPTQGKPLKSPHTLVGLGDNEEVLETEDKALSSLGYANELKQSIGQQRTFSELESQTEKLVTLAESDPLLALELALQDGAQFNDSTIAEILANWSQDSAEEAWEWALSNSREQSALLIQEIAKNDAALARSLAETFIANNPNDAFDMSGSLVKGLVHNGDYAGALDFVYTMSLKNGATTYNEGLAPLDYISHSLAKFMPQEGLEWVNNLPPEQDKLKEILRLNLLEEWTTWKPEETLVYGSSLPAGPERSTLLIRSLSEWANKDIESASRWIVENGDSPEYDEAILDIALQVEPSAQTIQDAIDWTESIYDPAIRENGTTEVLSRWMMNDPDAAQKYLDDNISVISESIRERVLTNARRHAFEEGE